MHPFVNRHSLFVNRQSLAAFSFVNRHSLFVNRQSNAGIDAGID